MKKNILITGASSGIGKALAEISVRRGHNVFMTGRNEDELIKIHGGRSNSFYFKCDVRNSDEVRIMCEVAKEEMGTIDVLINNAGVGIFDDVIGSNLEDWHTMIDVNIKGALNVLHFVLPHLIEARGHLINMGSVASHHVYPSSGVYCATKHALFAISESIRIELSKKIKVTTISPGSVNTPFIDQTKNTDLLKKFKKSFQDGMEPEWVAQEILRIIELPDNVNVGEIILRPFIK